jgi:hypothetical protein
MLYVSKSARMAHRSTGRIWLAVAYGLAAVLLVVLAVTACHAQAERIEDALASAVDG